MKHLKLFENTNKKLYVVYDVDDNDNPTVYAFNNKKDRNNFLINHIHTDFSEAGLNDVEDIFDIKKLVELYNFDGDNKIYLHTAEFLENVKLKPEIETHMLANKYNL